MTYYDAIQTKQKLDQFNGIIETLEAEKKTAEKTFIQDRGLCVDNLLDIKDENDFYSLLDDFLSLPEVIAINTKIMSIEAEKRPVEEDFLKEIISISPSHIAEGIRRFLHLQSFREKTIDVFLKNMREL